jgi:hypothetical protein
LGDYVSGAGVLTQVDALFASWPAIRSALSVFGEDALTVRAVVVVVINVSMLGWLFI